MFDDTLLDDPAALQRADRGQALLILARAGARVRTALRLAEAAGPAGPRPDGRPRTVLVAGHGSALAAARALAALAVTNCQVLPLAPSGVDPAAHGTTAFASGFTWQLPGWAGPLDLLVLCSADGAQPGLIALAQQAYIRGCAVAVIAPVDSPLAEAALQVRGLPLPYLPPEEETAPRLARSDEPDLPPEDLGALWAYLVPLLSLAERLEVTALEPGALAAAADRLDEVAVRCRPDAAGYDNPAKELAAQLSGTFPLLWADGPVTGAVVERFAALLADRAGCPAVSGRLPHALTTYRAMFVGQLGAGADSDDFFRDRIEEPSLLQLQVVLLRHTPAEAAREPEPSGPSGSSEYTVARARQLADAHEVRFTEHLSTAADPLQALAELTGLTDFTAVYLGLATGQA